MSIYQVIPLAANPRALEKAVVEAIEERHRHKLVNDMGWLISFNGTSVELSNALQVTGQPKGETSPVGAALVTSVTSYYGRGPSEMWEWLKTRFEEE